MAVVNAQVECYISSTNTQWNALKMCTISKMGLYKQFWCIIFFFFQLIKGEKKSIAISFFSFFKKGRKMGFGKKLSPLATKSFVAQRLRMESVIAFVDRYACALYANELADSQHCNMRYSNNNDR